MRPRSVATPEELAREQIDAMLTGAGWNIQSLRVLDFGGAKGVAVREVTLAHRTAGRKRRRRARQDPLRHRRCGRRLESDKTDSRPLEKKPTVAFDALLLGVVLGKREGDTLGTTTGRIECLGVLNS
jgi:hypothetical protein